jgi:16S rRNA (cytosine967-C5)-methyltransferase
MAITQETLRWMQDLDGLIDGATRQRLPDDAKARTVLRLMLAQALRLELPPHAVVATGLPLLAGGPRRLAHGVFSAVIRGPAKLPAAPTLPALVDERWQAAWHSRVGAIAAGLADPPPIDLTLRDPDATAEWAERLGGVSLMSGHVACHGRARWKRCRGSAKARGGCRTLPPPCRQGCWGRGRPARARSAPRRAARPCNSRRPAGR